MKLQAILDDNGAAAADGAQCRYNKNRFGLMENKAAHNGHGHAPGCGGSGCGLP
jgi:hypothetical protein